MLPVKLFLPVRCQEGEDEMSSEQDAVVVVSAVILYAGRVLIQRRDDDEEGCGGRWECPGGVVRLGEPLVLALEREILEELGKRVAVHRLLYTQINAYESGIDYLVLYYHCTLLDVPISFDAERVRLVLPTELEDFDMLPGTVEAVSHLGELTTVREEFSFVQNDVGNQTDGETLHVLTYNLGKVIEYYHKAKRYGVAAYYGEDNQQKEMSDLISMCRMYCEQRGWDFEGLMQLGEQGYLDRMEDIRKYGRKQG